METLNAFYQANKKAVHIAGGVVLAVLGFFGYKKGWFKRKSKRNT